MRRIDESTAGWSPDWDDEDDPSPEAAEKAPDQLQIRIAKAISNISNVDSALICSPNGMVIAQDKSQDQERDANLGVLVIDQAELIGGFLNSGPFVRAVLSGDENRFFVQKNEDLYLCLNLSKRSSAETVNKSIETVYKRYQSS